MAGATNSPAAARHRDGDTGATLDQVTDECRGLVGCDSAGDANQHFPVDHERRFVPVVVRIAISCRPDRNRADRHSPAIRP